MPRSLISNRSIIRLVSLCSALAWVTPAADAGDRTFASGRSSQFGTGGVPSGFDARRSDGGFQRGGGIVGGGSRWYRGGRYDDDGRRGRDRRERYHRSEGSFLWLDDDRRDRLGRHRYGNRRYDNHRSRRHDDYRSRRYDAHGSRRYDDHENRRYDFDERRRTGIDGDDRRRDFFYGVNPAERGVAYRGVDEGDGGSFIYYGQPDASAWPAAPRPVLGPKVIDVATARLDRRPIGPSGIGIVESGGAKIIRIAPGYRLADRAPGEAKAPEQSDQGAIRTKGPSGATSLQPWSTGWLRHCKRAYRSFDADLGTFVATNGKIRFCSAE